MIDAAAHVRPARIMVAALACLNVLLAAGAVLAQPAAPRAASVWTEDFPGDRLSRAVAGGKTTVILSAGSSLAVENHVRVARYVAQRVADELMNALVLPMAPGRPGGTREVRDAVDRAIVAAGFRNVVIAGDEDTSVGDTSLERIAATLDAEWQPKGVRVYYVTAHEMRPGQSMTFNSDYLRRWGSRTIPAARRKSVEDLSELLFVDQGGRWLRESMIPAQDRPVVSAELGRVLVEQRVSSILNQIRALSPSHVR
jgi:hypothetical protein